MLPAFPPPNSNNQPGPFGNQPQATHVPPPPTAPQTQPIPYASLEQERQALRKSITTYKIVGAFVIAGGVIAAILLGVLGGRVLSPYAVAGAGFIVAGLIVFSHHKTNKFSERYLHALLPPVLQQYDKSIVYDFDGQLPEHLLHQSGLVGGFNRYDAQQLITGTLHRTNFIMGWVHAERKSGSGKNSNKVTVFKGVCMVVDFNKYFRSKVHLLPDSSENALWGLGRKMQFNNRHGASLTRMDNQEFEDAFKVYVSDEVEARYILTQDLMARILDMRSKLSHRIRIGFNQNLLTIAVPTPFFLKVNTKVPADHDPAIQRLRYELDAYISIIDDLNLNTRIWTKR